MHEFKHLKSFAGRLIRLLSALIFLTIPLQGHAQDRHALVIGNSDYGGGYELATPQRDADFVAAKLSQIGYKVHSGRAVQNLDLDAFNNEIDSFLSNIDDGSTTLIYYAGHGAASEGTNYLIPILPEGVRLRSDSDIRDRSISLQGIVERVERSNPSGVNVLFFDACRDAPVENFTRTIDLTGLTRIDTSRQPRGSFIGFSTEYGKLALDGPPTGNSPFAEALLTSLDTNAGAPIELFYKDIVDRVYNETDGKQFPIAESKIRGQHCIIECRAITGTPSPQQFGTLILNTKPVDAEACIIIDGWNSPNCAKQAVLPLNTPVEVTVKAKNHKTKTTVTRLTGDRHQLTVNLEPSRSNTLAIVSGVAAAVVIGVLLSSGSSGGDDNDADTFGLTLVPPQ